MCKGKGQKAHECPTRLKRQGKGKAAYNVTLSNSDVDSVDFGDKSPHERNFYALMNSHISTPSTPHADEDIYKRANLENESNHSREVEGDDLCEGECGITYTYSKPTLSH